MNLKPYLTKARLTIEIAGLCAVVLGISWVAGQCRTWHKPKPTPATIDQGTPIAGPTSSAPTVTESLPIARPDLTLDELKAAAKKYGLRLTTLTPAASKPSVATSGQAVAERRQIGASADVLTPAQTFPLLLAEESFKHAPSGADVDVSAWLPGYGERVDLRAVWRKWEPVPAASPKMPVCQSGGFLRNEAKWEKEFGAGALVTPDGIGPGGYGSVVYRGFSTGSANWGARGMVAVGQIGGEMTGFGLISGKVSW